MQRCLWLTEFALGFQHLFQLSIVRAFGKPGIAPLLFVFGERFEGVIGRVVHYELSQQRNIRIHRLCRCRSFREVPVHFDFGRILDNTRREKRALIDRSSDAWLVLGSIR